MIALALATTPIAITQPASPEVQQEIVVIGMKFRAMKFKAAISTKDGMITVKKCRVTKSSKDKEIDAIGCAVTRACAAAAPATPKELARCMEARGEAAIAELAQLRAGKAQ